MADKKISVADIVERRNESRKWMRNNVYEELREVFRSIKCKTKPIMKRDSSGQETPVEDPSVTNVCMPDTNIVWRKNVARMTAQPYRLRYRGGDPMLCEMLSALAAQQYDRSQERWHDRRVVMMAEAFGFGYSKLYWDRLSRMMDFRKRLVSPDGKVVFNDRASIMRSQGAPADEIEDAVNQLSPQMSDEEVSDVVASTGNEIVVPAEVSRYEGPCLKSVFIGDLFIEPGCLTIDDSNFVIEQYRETDIWLEKMLRLTYTDPDTRKEVPAFNPKAVKDLLDLQGETTQPHLIDDLKMMFENAIGRQTETEVMFPSRLRPRKKFDILEYHELDDDGRMWITWASEHYKDTPLGRMPYPWNFYGSSAYTEFVPLPDMIGPHGDSTPRLMRFLQAMHNRTVAQNFDYITNLLNKFVMRRSDVEIGDEVVRRGMFRELVVSDLNGMEVFEEPQLPAGAFEREAQIRNMEALLEPSMTQVDAGTDSNPMAGKLATTAILNAKTADSLTQFKIDGRDLYIRKLEQKKLWMNQQAAKDKWTIEAKFWGPELVKQVQQMDQVYSVQASQSNDLPPSGDAGMAALEQQEQAQNPNPQKPAWALSDRNGKTVAVELDPLDIQEDLHVEPESGSYLSVDDDLRSAAANDLAQIALNAPPGTIDIRKVLRFKLSTVRGIGDPDEYILPPPQGEPPPPFKGNINVNLPLDKVEQIPADIVNQLLPAIGMQPSAELVHRQTLDGVQKISRAADAAANLASPASQPDPNSVNPNSEKIGTPKQAAAL